MLIYVIIIVTNIVNNINNIMNKVAAETPHLSRPAARPAIDCRPQTINPTPKTMTRNGKIALLPRLLRDQLNHRLARNEDDATLLDWLNAAPAVKDFLARDFAGEPISQQNLHEWRHGGFVEWQTRQDLFAEAADLTDVNGEWDALAANDFTERLAAVLVVRYADALAGWNGGDDEAFRLKVRDLRRFNQDLAVLRRYNQSAARLKMKQMSFHQEAKQRTEATASARKQSEAGTRACDERLAQRRQEAEIATKIAPKSTCAAPLTSSPFAPAVVAPRTAASPASPHGGTAADLNVAALADAVANVGSSVLAQDLAKSCPSELQPMVAQPGPVPVPNQGSVKCDAGNNRGVGAATMAAGLVRASLVVEFADSLSNALTVIKEKSVHAFNLKDRRAVQSAYAGSVATVNRLCKETGLLRADLPGFAEVDRVGAAVEALQLEYPRMKSNLFQACSAAVTVGIQQLRESACELRETLQRKPVTGAPLPALVP
jgi:hypothetical protein